MSPTGAASTTHRAASGAGRLARAYRTLAPERRLAAYAALGLFVTMFLPWYQRQFFVVLSGHLQPASDTQTAWAAFSFVEAAVLLVAIGVLTLLFHRAEGRAFHLPGGDGWVITAAGFWTCVLVIWRIFDKQGATAHGQAATSYGIEWGIFVALAVAALLIYAGSRIRAAHTPEPALPGEAAPPNASQLVRRRAPGPARREPRAELTVDPPEYRHAPRRPVQAPPRPVAADEPPTRRLTGPSTQAARDQQLTMPLEPDAEQD